MTFAKGVRARACWVSLSTVLLMRSACLLLVLLGAGCFPTCWVAGECAPRSWYRRPGGTQADFERDHYACEREARVYQPNPFDQPEWVAKCMRALGYRPGP